MSNNMFKGHRGAFSNANAQSSSRPGLSREEYGR